MDTAEVQAAEQYLTRTQGLTTEEAHRAVEHLLAAGVEPAQLKDYMNDIIVLVEAGLDAYFTEILSGTRD